MFGLVLIIAILHIPKSSSNLVDGQLSNHTCKKICKCITYDTVEEKFLEEKIRVIERTNFAIKFLHENLIQDMIHVEKIILTWNGIETIKSSAFRNLSSLKSVDLSNNVISIIEFGIFSNTPKITRISLAKNHLWHFQPEWFGDIPNLEWLNLEYNTIKTILKEAFFNFPNLRYINLGHNKIMHIDETAFKNIHKLEILDLSYNRLSYLDEALFSQFEDLHVLNLYSNEFSHLSDNTLNSLTSLREFIVLFNPWQCECYNRILDWAGNNFVGVRNKYLKCEKTKQLENIPVCVFGSQTSQCIENKLEELCDILYLQQPDFECGFLYNDYLGI